MGWKLMNEIYFIAHYILQPPRLESSMNKLQYLWAVTNRHYLRCIYSGGAFECVDNFRLVDSLTSSQQHATIAHVQCALSDAHPRPRCGRQLPGLLVAETRRPSAARTCRTAHRRLPALAGSERSVRDAHWLGAQIWPCVRRLVGQHLFGGADRSEDDKTGLRQGCDHWQGSTLPHPWYNARLRWVQKWFVACKRNLHSRRP